MQVTNKIFEFQRVKFKDEVGRHRFQIAAHILLAEAYVEQGQVFHKGAPGHQQSTDSAGVW